MQVEKVAGFLLRRISTAFGVENTPVFYLKVNHSIM
jgi:hypothetical protein